MLCDDTIVAVSKGGMDSPRLYQAQKRIVELDIEYDS